MTEGMKASSQGSLFLETMWNGHAPFVSELHKASRPRSMASTTRSTGRDQGRTPKLIS